MAVSNYDIMKRDAARLFAQTDHTALIKRFCLAEEDGLLPLSFFGQPYRGRLENGAVERARNGAWQEAGYNDSMTIYDLLGYAQPTCHASGRMINTRSLHTQIAATAPSNRLFYRRQEQIMEKHANGLQEALETLGGTPLGKADASAEFVVLGDLAMQVHFWRADEDFPPSLELFWDENVLQYLHYETVWYANSFMVEEIVARCEALA